MFVLSVWSGETKIHPGGDILVFQGVFQLPPVTRFSAPFPRRKRRLPGNPSGGAAHPTTATAIDGALVGWRGFCVFLVLPPGIVFCKTKMFISNLDFFAYFFANKKRAISETIILGRIILGVLWLQDLNSYDGQIGRNFDTWPSVSRVILKLPVFGTGTFKWGVGDGKKLMGYNFS